MNDDLDNKSDAELNELFAVEVAGWIPGDAQRPNGGAAHFREPDNDNWHAYWSITRFCTDANAVLPWLEKWHAENITGRSVEVSRAGNCHSQWFITLVTERESEKYDYSLGQATAFPRAAVIALLRAKRATP